MRRGSGAILLAVFGLLAGAACGSGPDGGVDAAVARAQALASENSARATVTVTVTSTGASSPMAPKATGTRSTVPSPAATAAAADGWSNYPWAANDDGKACPAPALVERGERPVAVVLGDSTIRNARTRIQAALLAAGYDAVFVCWGGKTTRWGQEQISLMRARGMLPRCLVVNLGINDVKRDRDAVSATVLRARISNLVLGLADVPGLVVVNIWGDPKKSGGLMPEMGPTVPAFRDALAANGRSSSLVDWAAAVQADAELMGSDGIHDSENGESVRARLIAERVGALCR